MSIGPPKTESGGSGIPGMVIPLGFISVILLGAVLVFGALAFGIDLPGMSSDNEADYAAPQNVLESSGFTMRERTVGDDATTVEVEVAILNTGNLPVQEFQVMVQCTDNGYVSAILEVSPMDAGESRTVAMELSGRGEPSCSEPVIDFTPIRPT